MVEQSFRRGVFEAGIKNSFFEGKVASGNDAEGACTQSTKEPPAIPRSHGLYGVARFRGKRRAAAPRF